MADVHRHSLTEIEQHHPYSLEMRYSKLLEVTGTTVQAHAHDIVCIDVILSGVQYRTHTHEGVPILYNNCHRDPGSPKFFDTDAVMQATSGRPEVPCRRR